MAYYLRQDKKKKGTYLQMYESYWDKEKKQPRSRNIESFGMSQILFQMRFRTRFLIIRNM